MQGVVNIGLWQTTTIRQEAVNLSPTQQGENNFKKLANYKFIPLKIQFIMAATIFYFPCENTCSLQTRFKNQFMSVAQ